MLTRPMRGLLLVWRHAGRRQGLQHRHGTEGAISRMDLVNVVFFWCGSDRARMRSLNPSSHGEEFRALLDMSSSLAGSEPTIPEGPSACIAPWQTYVKLCYNQAHPT